MATNPETIGEVPQVIFDLRGANLGMQAQLGFLHPVKQQQDEEAHATISHYIGAVTAERVNSGGQIGQQIPRPSQATRTDDWGFDLPAFLQQQQEVVRDLLEEQLERAVDLLIDCRLAGGPVTLADKRRILFDLYDAGAASKSQVRERGRLEPGEFHEELRAYRTRSRQR